MISYMFYDILYIFFLVQLLFRVFSLPLMLFLMTYLFTYLNRQYMHMVRNSNSRGRLGLPYTLLQVLQGHSLEATTVTKFLSYLPEIVHVCVCACTCVEKGKMQLFLYTNETTFASAPHI